MGHTQLSGHIKMTFHQYKFLCILFLLLISGFSYSQRIDDWFKVELDKRLNPKIDTLQEKEVLLFIAKPSFVDPEYSIRVIDRGNQTFLEVRLIEKNLWTELFRLRRQGSSEVSLQTHFFSIEISTTFKNKMVGVFSKAILINENSKKKPSGPRTFDGTCFEFRINDNGKNASTTIDYELKYDDFEYQVAMTNLRIVDALKRHFFDESVYQVYNNP